MGDVVEVAEHVFLVRGSNVNWYLLREGTDLTLVDAGYPGDLDWVEESVRSLGRRPEDIGAILLTHAHVDRMGAINAFHGPAARRTSSSLTRGRSPPRARSTCPGGRCRSPLWPHQRSLRDPPPRGRRGAQRRRARDGPPDVADRGPQVLPGMFQHARTPAADPLAPFESLDADLLLPGHAEPHRAPIAEVVRAARAHH